MKVEFSNNGVTDSLTGAPAPRNFFENLAREISKSRRKYQPLAIMTFKYLALEEKLAKKYEAEKELMELGIIVKKSIRSGDFYSRMAQDGFWVCLHADELECGEAKIRINEKIKSSYELKKSQPILNTSRVEIAINLWDGEMNQSSWIEKVDSAYFGDEKESNELEMHPKVF